MTKALGAKIDPKVNAIAWRGLRYHADRILMSHVLQHTVWPVDAGGLRLLCEAIPLRGVEHE